MNHIINEDELHLFLRDRGFVTNFRKNINSNGEDVIAIKDGYAFKIEFKKVVKNNTTGAYKLSDDNILGDICFCSSPSGKNFVILNEKTSLTKTVRFLEMLD